MFDNRPWIQSAIDQFDMENGKRCARMAVKSGADWIEVGTPLIYSEGFAAIGELKKIAGDLPVITDFKIRTGVYDVLVTAKKYGCDIATISCAGGNDTGIIEGLRARRTCGIKIVGDMCGLELQDIGRRSRELAHLGVDAICIHYGDDQWFYNYRREMSDGVLAAREAAPDTPLGVCVGYIPPGKGTGWDTAGNIIEALKQGADWVVVGGPIANGYDEETHRAFQFVADIVHNSRKSDT
jgi:3-hexulose-6-phosphate synthase/6-phospho-3-hexuloisomerase